MIQYSLYSGVQTLSSQASAEYATAISDAAAAAAAATTKLDDVTESLEIVQSRLTLSEADAENHADKVSDLEADLSAAQDRVDMLKSAADDATAEAAERDTQLAVVTEQLAEAVEQLRTAQEAAVAAEEGATQQKSMIAELTCRGESQQAAAAAAEEAAAAAGAVAAVDAAAVAVAAAAEISHLTKEVATLEEHAASHQDAAGAAAGQLAEATAKIATLQATADQMSESLTAAAKKGTLLEAQLCTTHSELTAGGTHAQILAEELEVAQTGAAAAAVEAAQKLKDAQYALTAAQNASEVRQGTRSSPHTLV